MLKTTGAAWEEWKTETQLQRLAQKYPSRYQKTETGNWHCPPGVAHAESFGLKYHVRTDTELHPIFTQNLIFLEDYFRFKSNIPLFIVEQILTTVQATPGTTIATTLASIPGVRANDIYAMIATEQLYVDLYAVPLVEHWRVQLWADGQTHAAYTHLALGTTGHHREITSPTKLLPNTLLVWDSQLWTLVNLGETTTTLLPEVGQLLQLPTAFFLQLFDSGTTPFPL